MIKIVLSERDFDYELQSLVNSFFPGQKSTVVIAENENTIIEKELLEQQLDDTQGEFLGIGILFCRNKIIISVCMEDFWIQKSVSISGEQDWHRHEDKSTHPYRMYYKNELKRLLFILLSEIEEEKFPSDVHRQIPVWGTMTGVRPTKIPMNELLQGKTPKEVEDSLRKWYCCTEEKLDLGLSIAMREAKLLQNIDFEGNYSLYIGIPFCPTTCLYCSFTSYPYEKFGYLAKEYLKALKKEIGAVAKNLGTRQLTSIYMGGGTPTTLSPDQLDDLLGYVRECFPMKESYEFTVEAGRPDSITKEKLEVLRKYGVERISVNPQTMQQKTLDLIGRKHTVENTKKAFYMARELGFSNINMDLIIGLPGEELADFEDTLSQIKQLNPDSITVHSLVVKRASRLRNVLEEMEQAHQIERDRMKQMDLMMKMAQKFAKEEEYLPYYMYRQKNSAGHFGSSGQENIGFSRLGKECLYNILIMEEMQTIVAVGAGASTKLYHPEKKIVSRVENVKSITDYINRIDEMIERKKDIFQTDKN